MKKLCIILALLLAIAIPVSAGGSGESEAQDSGKRVFTFWDSIFKTDLNANAYLRTVKEVFEEMHPDVELQIITKGRPEQQIDALTIAFSSDDGPDAFGYSIGSLMDPFIESGKLMDLRPIIEKNGWDKQMVKASWDMEQQLWGDHRYALPIEHTAMGVYYRKDLYEKFGLEVPKTYEEFIHNCEVLQENGIVAIGNAGKLPAITNRWFDALLEKNCGIELHDALLSGDASLNCPEVVESLYELKDLSRFFQEGHLSAEESEVYMLWYPGKACHFYTATWQADTFETQGQDISLYGYFRFPTDQTPWRSNSFCYGVYINENTPNKDLVEDLPKAFASDRAFQTAFDEKTSIVGSRPDVFDLSKLDPLRQELISDVNNPDGSYMPSNEMCWPPRLTDELFEVLDQVIMNLMTPEEGAAQLDELAAEIGFYRF